ncbi:MAG: glycosyltransferase [Deltaproteobacteria bacterium]|nr:glycosyltransferase [Deltaproteobacteria bacterium]
MDPGMVSVIIPTYNRARFIEEAVDSVLGQTYPNFEVLIIDDGSTDATRDLIQRRYGSDTRVRYIYKENGGVSSARNRAFPEARGEFFAFLDSDDLWHPEKLALQLEGLRLTPQAGMIWSDMAAIDGAGKVLCPRYLTVMYENYVRFPDKKDLFSEETKTSYGSALYSGNIFSQMVLGNLVHTSTVLLRRERALQTGIFREDYRRGGEDYDFHLRACRLGPVAFTDAVTIKYRVELEDQLTNKDNHVAMAMAFLSTLLRTIENERAQIKLTDTEIEQCLADAYAWIGRENLALGRVVEARKYLMMSFGVMPWQTQNRKLLALSFAPERLGAPIVKILRHARRLARTRR